MEILNECSDVDEIKFQEDGSWCPMRPKKEAVKVSSSQCTKIESMYTLVVVADQQRVLAVLWITCLDVCVVEGLILVLFI